MRLLLSHDCYSPLRIEGSCFLKGLSLLEWVPHQEAAFEALVVSGLLEKPRWMKGGTVLRAGSCIPGSSSRS